MGWNDHLVEEFEKQAVLESLIESGEIEDARLGVARKVLADGEGSLIGRQVGVFQFLKDEYLDLECTRCGVPIPDSELVFAWDNKGKCSWCVKMEDNKD